MRRVSVLLCLFAAVGVSDDNRSLSDRTVQYLTDLVRLDTSNPPGNETRVAEYLKQVADSYGISAEVLGSDPHRKNFVARLRGNGRGRPLMLIAHSDVVPARRSQWTVDPFSGENRNGFIYGRGTQDTKSLLAAELAVMVEIKRRNLRLNRDLILVSEADEEAGSSGIQWLMQHAWPKIDAEFALGEGGSILQAKDGTRLFQVQTAEKIPARLLLTARGESEDGSPPADNPVLRLARALVKLSDAEQPVRLNATTRQYLRGLAGIPDYHWLTPLWPRLDNPAAAPTAANNIRARDPEIGDMLHTSVSPTMLKGGIRINVIPNTAEAEVDVRCLPSETHEDLLARFRHIISDDSIDVGFAPGRQIPVTEPSSLTTPLYRALERAIAHVYPYDALVVPYMSRYATDNAYLRARGMAVYGVPVFLRQPGQGHAHANDERIASKVVGNGVELLWQMVLETVGAN
jgi:acetylornithine deacetylase/succinyl-diaminopimelate desuccinylase-like protein